MFVIVCIKFWSLIYSACTKQWWIYWIKNVSHVIPRFILLQTWLMLRSIALKFEKWFSWMCLTSCNTFQNHLLSQKENLIFWPQKWIFEISEAIFDSFWHPNMRKRHSTATSKVSKKLLRPSIENRLGTFLHNVLAISLIPLTWSYDQNWHRETLKTEKKQ